MIEIKKGENIYTTPNPEGGPDDYVCVNCDFKGTEREVLNHTCNVKEAQWKPLK